MLLTIAPTPAPDTVQTTSSSDLTTAIIGMVGVALGALISGVISWKLHRQEAREARRRIAMEKLAEPCGKAVDVLRFWEHIPQVRTIVPPSARSRREQLDDAFLDASVWVEDPKQLQNDFDEIYELMGKLESDTRDAYRSEVIEALLAIPSKGQSEFHRRLKTAARRGSDPEAVARPKGNS